jgi:hypothetical protein
MACPVSSWTPPRDQKPLGPHGLERTLVSTMSALDERLQSDEAKEIAAVAATLRRPIVSTVRDRRSKKVQTALWTKNDGVHKSPTCLPPRPSGGTVQYKDSSVLDDGRRSITNFRSYSRRRGRSRRIRRTCACGAGGRGRFRASRHHRFRPDSPATLGRHGRRAGARRCGSSVGWL